jgi:hypothetical protein
MQNIEMRGSWFKASLCKRHNTLPEKLTQAQSAGRMAQVVEWFSRKHEAMSSNPNSVKNKLLHQIMYRKLPVFRSPFLTDTGKSFLWFKDSLMWLEDLWNLIGITWEAFKWCLRAPPTDTDITGLRCGPGCCNVQLLLELKATGVTKWQTVL